MYSLILHGRRSFELQKLRHLSVSMNPLQNIFSAFSSSFSHYTEADLRHPQYRRKGYDFAVSYLVDSLGLTTKLAESISKKVIFSDKLYPDSVLNLLRSHGFTDSQMSSMITNYPLLLVADVEKSLGPKLKVLLSRGASSFELIQILSKAPKILGKSDEKTISLYYDFVKEIIEADKSSKYEKLCHSLPQGDLEDRIRNISALRELGVPQRWLLHLLTANFPPVRENERFEASLKKVVEKGFDPTTSNFVQALQVFYDLSDEIIEENLNSYRRLGFSECDVWEMFKKYPLSLSLEYRVSKLTRTLEILRMFGLNHDEVVSVMKKNPHFIHHTEHKMLNCISTFPRLGFSDNETAIIVKRFPQCLNLSAESVKKKIEFVVKKLNWPLKVVALRPQVIGLSMEKRIVPRCNVIEALISKGLLGSENPLMLSVLTSTDEVFLKRYVRKHDDKQLEAELMSIFTRDYETQLEH